MKKKKKNGEDYSEYAKDLLVGGATLSVGAGVVESLPLSAAKTGVQEGLGTAGGFFVPLATIGAAGIVMKQVRRLKPKKDKREGYGI